MLVVREESDTDFVGVYALVKEAFAPMPYAGGDEQDLVNILRELGACDWPWWPSWMVS